MTAILEVKTLEKKYGDFTAVNKVSFEVDQAEGFADQQVEETKAALRELGLRDDVKTE